MVNNQVTGKRKGREGLAEGRTNSLHPQAGCLEGLYKRKDAQGQCLQGALWSLAAYEKYLHVFATLGPSVLSCQVGTWGMLGPSAL